MTEAARERVEAGLLPEDDVIAVLLQQHARIRELFAQVQAASGEFKTHTFDDLRAFLASHEAAEEMVVRPATRGIAEAVAEARNEEEKEASKVLAELEDLDVDSTVFDSKLAAFEQAVSRHAEQEETQEFPLIRQAKNSEERIKMGRTLLRVEKFAPTHPHPSTAGSSGAQWAVGPFASMVDRAKDAVKSVMSDDKG
jgi:hemerythrin-like domain-containing protein